MPLAILALLLGAYLIDSGIRGVNPLSDFKKRISTGSLSTAVQKGSGDASAPVVNPTNPATVVGQTPVTAATPKLAAAANAALNTASYVKNQCEKFVEGLFGTSAQYASAQADWNAQLFKHAGDPNPPAGALVYWANSNGLGHVAISLGNGSVRSTDFSNGQYTPGVVGTSTIAQLSQGMTYLGWAEPSFTQ